MFSNSRSQSLDLLVWDDGNQNDNSHSEKVRSISLESGLENIESVDSVPTTSRNEKDFIITELKQQCKEKDNEIIRLKSVESNYGQAKQQLKDTKWMLKVRSLFCCLYVENTLKLLFISLVRLIQF